MLRITRRRLLGAAVAGVIGRAPASAATAQSAGTPKPAERAAMAAAATDFMRKYAVPGLSVAIARAGTLVYAGAFGVAERSPRTPLTSAHRFRIASVTKPITSVTIFALTEQQTHAASP